MEYAYTRQETSEDALATAFIEYLAAKDHAATLNDVGYPPRQQQEILCGNR